MLAADFAPPIPPCPFWAPPPCANRAPFDGETLNPLCVQQQKPNYIYITPAAAPSLHFLQSCLKPPNLGIKPLQKKEFFLLEPSLKLGLCSIFITVLTLGWAAGKPSLGLLCSAGTNPGAPACPLQVWGTASSGLIIHPPDFPWLSLAGGIGGFHPSLLPTFTNVGYQGFIVSGESWLGHKIPPLRGSRGCSEHAGALFLQLALGVCWD